MLEEKVYTLKVLKYTKSRPRESELVNEVIDLRNAKEMLINNYKLISMVDDIVEDGTGDAVQGDSSGDDANKKTEQDIITSESTKDSTIKTEGRIKSNAGETQRKIISVTVPTAAMFTVNKDADFIGSNINIRNNGEEPVDIIINDFIDASGNYDIKVITNESVRKNNSTKRTTDTVIYRRNEINLFVKGNIKKLYLGNGKVLESLGSETNLISDSDKRIAKVLANQTVGLALGGEAGTADLEKNSPIKDRFTLILKIKKSMD